MSMGMGDSSNDNDNYDAIEDEVEFLEESRNYCICFIDMIDSTRIASKLYRPAQVRIYYSTFLNAISAIAKRFNAQIVKNAGDSVICYFPQTTNSDDKPAFRNVIECCMTMISERQAINSRLGKNTPDVSYRISADYGRVEVAKSKANASEDLFGSTMNFCAKINCKAIPNGIIIGSDLYQMLKSHALNHEYHFEMTGDYQVDPRHSYPVYSVTRKNKTENRIENSSHKMPLVYARFDIKSVRQPHRIMVLDDEADIAFTYKSMLTNSGYSVDAFTDPHDALRSFTDGEDAINKYSLILIDIRMAKINGLQFYQILRTLNKQVKIKFISALDMAGELVSIFPEVKRADVLKKPVAIKDLQDIVDSNAA